MTNTDPYGHCPTCALEMAAAWAQFKAAHPMAAARVEHIAAGIGLTLGGAATAVAASGAGALGAPETGGTSLALTVAGGSAGAGMITAGGMELLRGITGSTDPGITKAEDAVQTIANPVGLAATVAKAGICKRGKRQQR